MLNGWILLIGGVDWEGSTPSGCAIGLIYQQEKNGVSRAGPGKADVLLNMLLNRENVCSIKYRELKYIFSIAMYTLVSSQPYQNAI